ncbi:MAG: phosphate acyltransferase, partial [Clostridia bacterium]|nr:phosphate acyltransferase [Clostridia bacterium]
MLMKNTFKSLKTRLDYKQYGGSLFLGCKKNILKAHGDSKAPAFLACIRQAINVAKHDVNAEIEKTLATLEIEE